MLCIPLDDRTDVAGSEDVLNLCTETRDPRRSVGCFDDSPTQLIGELLQPIPAVLGDGAYDRRYPRHGRGPTAHATGAHQKKSMFSMEDARAKLARA
jgi:hypothetical protein